MRVVLGSILFGLTVSVIARDAAAQSTVGDSDLFHVPTLGFQMWFPHSFRVDTLAQPVLDRVPGNSSVHAWEFMKPEPPENWRPGRLWQRVGILWTEGVGINQRQWDALAAGYLKGMLDKAPGGTVVENVVRWRDPMSDTAEFRVGIHNPAKGEFENWRCLGSQVGRSRSAKVCVHTAAPTVEALAAVRESLVLTPPVTRRP